MSANSKSSKGIFRTIPAKLVDAERKAAIKHGKSLDGIATAAYSNFFDSITRSERAALIDQIPAKKMGRKVK